MKKLQLFITILVFISFVSCEKTVEFNTPGFQAKINNNFWKASSMSAKRGAGGSITIEGFSGTDQVVLGTNSAAKGTYVLGTSNTLNKAKYASSDTNIGMFQTVVVASAVNKLTLYAGGTGYSTAVAVPTTPTLLSTGTGLKVDISTNSLGVITQIVVNTPGTGYKSGDLLTVTGGTGNARLLVQNVLISNGEIVITDYDGAKLSGNYKFTAYNAVNDETAVCRDGVFYKIPIE